MNRLTPPVLARLLLAFSIAPTALALLSSAPPPLSYPPAIQRSIQHWDASTLRQQILSHHVAKIAFHHDARAVEVLDVNGLQRRVEIFPDIAPVLVDSCRKGHVSFFVLPDQTANPMLVAFARSFVLTLVVILVIDALGLMEMLIWGCAILGYNFYIFLAQLDAALVQYWTEFHARLSRRAPRDKDSMEALYVRVDDDDEL
ncbi:hypothetical protein AB1Y20_002743 [Prymnesium parvum]|uniref:Autophagy-related protein 9 n=1 Tax=Prymnesium parvum TaxID=97485 RepID=A0AB34J9Y4_PRYPA